MNENEPDDDAQDAYYVISEDAIKYLPDEWQKSILERAEDGRKILEADDNQLKSLSRISLPFIPSIYLEAYQR